MKVTELIDKVTLPLKYKLVLAVGTGMLIFVPRELSLRYLGFSLEGPARVAVGLVFLLFTAFSAVEIIINAGTALFNWVVSAIRKHGEGRRVRAALASLTDKEKDYLAVFQRDKSVSADLPINDGVTHSLIQKELVSMAGTISKRGMLFPCNLNPIAWEFFRNNPSFLQESIDRINSRRGSR